MGFVSEKVNVAETLIKVAIFFQLKYTCVGSISDVCQVQFISVVKRKANSSIKKQKCNFMKR